MTDRRPFICDLDGDEEHLRQADDAYRRGRTVRYVGKGTVFEVTADDEELRTFRTGRR